MVLPVGRPVELLLDGHVGRVELHLLEDAELGEPGLRPVGYDEVGHLERVLGVDDVEVGLERDDVIVQTALGALVDAWSPLVLVLVVGNDWR
jgi:hypothetical protein